MASDIKLVFIASGTKADFKPPTPNDFTERAGNRARAIILRARSKSPGPFTASTLRFIHFNFGGDKVEVHDFDSTKKSLDWAKKSFPWTDFSSFTATGDPSFDPKTFVDAPTTANTMSITHVYHSIRRAPAASVLELNIFSHAFVEGPVLVNTTDHQPPDWSPGNPKRDDADRDGRLRTDFFPNMGEDPAGSGKNALTEFTAAFATNGSFRVYGCDVQDVVVDPDTGDRALLVSTVFQVLHQAVAKPIGRAVRKKTDAAAVFGKKLLKGPKPDGSTTITLDMSEEFSNEKDRTDNEHDHFPTIEKYRSLHYSIDTLFFQNESNLVLTRTWSELIQFVARRTMELYVFKAADATGVTCFGAVPGTGGELEAAMANPQMRVCRQPGFGCAKDELYSSYLWFFEKLMDVSCTEKDADIQRNYGIFDSATIAKIKDHATNG